MYGEIKRFLKRTGISEGAFGSLVANEVHLVEKIRRGRKLDPETENRIRLWMQNYDER